MLYDNVYNPVAEILSTKMTWPTSADRERAKRLPNEVRAAKLRHCFDAATCLAKYRETFGLKTPTSFQFQQSAQASFMLLSDMHSHPPKVAAVLDSSSKHNESLSSTLGEDERRVIAFEECFRFILCHGLQSFIARGVAKSIYLLAHEYDCRFPEAVETMFDVLKHTSWQTSDAQYFSSTYPSYAFTEVAFENTDYQIESMVRRMEALVVDQN